MNFGQMGYYLERSDRRIISLNSITIDLKDADEIEAFYLETTGMKPGYIPLSAGTSGLKTNNYCITKIIMGFNEFMAKSFKSQF